MQRRSKVVLLHPQHVEGPTNDSMITNCEYVQCIYHPKMFVVKRKKKTMENFLYVVQTIFTSQNVIHKYAFRVGQKQFFRIVFISFLYILG